MRLLAAGLLMVLWAAPARALKKEPEPPAGTAAGSAPVQKEPEPPAGTAAGSAPARLPEQDLARDRLAKLAQALSPAEYPPAFFLGAQAELATPGAGATGISALLFGYDAVWMQADVSVGMGVGGGMLREGNAPDVYSAGLRLGVPVHRGLRADFGLVASGAVIVLDLPQGGTETLGQAGAGARFRTFLSPNIAVAGSLGLAVLFDANDSFWVLGARPLGAAAVVYYFR